MPAPHRDGLYAFDATLHGLPVEPAAGPAHDDAWGTWPTLSVEHARIVVPLRVGFDDAFARLALLERMFVEPDGSFVWTSPREGLSWQVDGNAFEKDGRVLMVDLKGSCQGELSARGVRQAPRGFRLARRGRDVPTGEAGGVSRRGDVSPACGRPWGGGGWGDFASPMTAPVSGFSSPAGKPARPGAGLPIP
jgi:hypothetical protein